MSRTKRVTKGSATVTIEVDVDVTVHWIDDSGVWRTPNGDGEPPSTEMESFEFSARHVELAIEDEVAKLIYAGKFDQ